jgi:hypothetical protein
MDGLVLLDEPRLPLLARLGGSLLAMAWAVRRERTGRARV